MFFKKPILSNEGKKIGRCLILLMGTIFTTTHSISIHAQTRTPILSQITLETLTSSKKIQLVQTNGKLYEFHVHDNEVTSAVFSPDGQQILTASNDKTARLWDKKGNLIQVFQGHKNGVTSAVFSPNGKQILTASNDKTARLWDKKGNLIQVFQGHKNGVTSAVFSPNGKQILTASNDKTARLWDKKGNLIQVFQGHKNGVTSAVFSPNGKQILTASNDKTARLWDKKGKILAILRGHKEWLTSAVFSPDGRQILTASNDKTARLWNVSDAIAGQSKFQQMNSPQIFQEDVSQNNLQLGVENISNILQKQINIIESLRTQIASQELRRSYFASNQDYYQFYINLLMQLHQQNPKQGYDAEALHISERARARSLLELITEANADIRTGVDPQLLQAENNIKQQLDQIEKRRVQLLSGKYTDTQKKDLEIQTAKLLNQYRNIQTQIRSNSPRYAAITQPQPLTLTEIQQQVLDQNTLLLEYSLGAEKTYLWAISQTGMNSYELNINNQQIKKLVKDFRNEIVKAGSSKRRVAKAATKLTKILLEPVAEKLGNKRLVIVGDGALQYLPFAALSTPNSQEYQPLIINHEIVTLPSASTVALIRTQRKNRKPASKSIAILADPVFKKDDPRFTDTSKPTQQNTENLNNLALKRASDNTNIDFERLSFTRKEAETILKLVPKNQSLQALDFAANRDFATNPQLSEYRIIHFATHGIIDSKQPELSGLVLSLFDKNGQAKNGFLRLHDVFNLNLSAELVVLSACQTGLGEQIKGEGVIGLTTGFIYAGSPRVVMSLWSVDDEGTSVLIEKFYQKMLKEGLKPASALRQAQIEMFNNKNYSKADYWAAFTLQGEWR